MLLLPLTQADDVVLDKLDDGPGVLPFKLGHSKIISHYHSFLQYIRLDEINDKIGLVQTQLQSFKPKINNKTLFLFEPHLVYLETKLDKVLLQLLSFEPNRARRGLIDGLGSVIKSISGNLDYTDAIKYNNAIKVLQDNENKLETEYNQHISLTKVWMSRHTKIIDDIVSNQKEITKLLETTITNESNRDADVLKFAHLAQYLLILGDNIDNLSEELFKLETNLAFIRTSSFSHSMLDINSLQKIVNKLTILYSKNEIVDISLREYYDIIKLGSYYIDNQIVIVYKVPIATPEVYNLYKLSIIPNRNNQALIPTLPYVAIATQGNDSKYMEAECPRLNTWYLCTGKANYEKRSHPDCIQHLITTQQIHHSCKLSYILLTQEAVEQLDDQHYTISLPKPTKVQISCGQEQYKTLQGSYLVKLPYKCFMKTPGFTISNLHDTVKGYVLRIMNLPPTSREITDDKKPSIQLNSINLKNLHDSNTKISLQSPIQIDQVTNQSLYHTTIPIYVILLSAIALGSVISFRRIMKKRQSKTQPELNIPEPIYARVQRGSKKTPQKEKIDINRLTAVFSPRPSNSCSS